MIPTRRSGFTVVELIIAISILAILLTKIALVINAASQAVGDSSKEMVLEDQARRVINQIGFALMGSDRDTLFPQSADPDLPVTQLRYQLSLGLEDGEIVWDDIEEIGLGATGSQVYWTRKPGEPDERRVFLTNLVRPYLEGELANGIDDNGNGLVDEQGLTFVIDRNSVHIRLSLARPDMEGGTIANTVEAVVTCRN